MSTYTIIQIIIKQLFMCRARFSSMWILDEVTIFHEHKLNCDNSQPKQYTFEFHDRSALQITSICSRVSVTVSVFFPFFGSVFAVLRFAWVNPLKTVLLSVDGGSHTTSFFFRFTKKTKLWTVNTIIVFVVRNGDRFFWVKFLRLVVPCINLYLFISFVYGFIGVVIA